MSGDEKIMAAALIVTVGLWISGSSIGVGAPWPASPLAVYSSLSLVSSPGKECLASVPLGTP